MFVTANFFVVQLATSQSTRCAWSTLLSLCYCSKQQRCPLTFATSTTISLNFFGECQELNPGPMGSKRECSPLCYGPLAPLRLQTLTVTVGCTLNPLSQVLMVGLFTSYGGQFGNSNRLVCFMYCVQNELAFSWRQNEKCITGLFFRLAANLHRLKT